MALWLMRGGRDGEYEERFFNDNRIYMTWTGLPASLLKATISDDIRVALRSAYPDESDNVIGNWTGQVTAFMLRMNIGDLVVTPRKRKSLIAVGKLRSALKYDSKAEGPFQFYRDVNWLTTELQRVQVKQDLLYSLGAFMTVCEISRNSAEMRFNAMANAGWKNDPGPIPFLNVSSSLTSDTSLDHEGERIDLELSARDEIAKAIESKFKGHGMARLVEAVLEAQGFTTYRSAEGADKGIDILASAGPLGFGDQRICVQVKSGDAPTDRPTMDQLIGAMANVGANQGLLVAWAGFKSSVNKELAQQFFKVRLWNQEDLIEQVLRHYDDLDGELQAELPLKRIWILVPPEL